MAPDRGEDEIRLPAGLWKEAVTQFDTLALNGKLIHGPYSTTIHDEGGFKIAFQLAPHLNNKPVQPADAPERKFNNVKSNPFAHPDPQFTLGPVGPAYTLMLNKFCVYRPSLLLVTREFAPQSRALDATDVRAGWAALRHFSREAGPEVPLTLIYNCGAESGSSQGHKHMQLLPHPRTDEGRVFELFPGKATSADEIAEDLAGVQHRHFVLRLPADVDGGGVVRAHDKLLARMRESVAQERNGQGEDESDGPPHNVVMTTDWICLIPRRHSGTERGTPANALGMVGVVWTTRSTEADRWIEESGTFKEHLTYLGYPIQ